MARVLTRLVLVLRTVNSNHNCCKNLAVGGVFDCGEGDGNKGRIECF